MRPLPENLKGLSQDDALDIFNQMCSEYGWSGTIFNRNDVEESVGRYLTDEEWNKVRAAWAWKKGMESALNERGWDLIDDALIDAKIIKEPKEE